jgi:hypothetical protein
MTAAGIVYPITDSALQHTSPIMIATLRALVGGAVLTAILPLFGSRLPRSRRLRLWAFAIGLGNTTLTQVGISVGTDRAGAAVASVLVDDRALVSRWHERRSAAPDVAAFVWRPRVRQICDAPQCATRAGRRAEHPIV